MKSILSMAIELFFAIWLCLTLDPDMRSIDEDEL